MRQYQYICALSANNACRSGSDKNVISNIYFIWKWLWSSANHAKSTKVTHVTKLWSHYVCMILLVEQINKVVVGAGDDSFTFPAGCVWPWTGGSCTRRTARTPTAPPPPLKERENNRQMVRRNILLPLSNKKKKEKRNSDDIFRDSETSAHTSLRIINNAFNYMCSWLALSKHAACADEKTCTSYQKLRRRSVYMRVCCVCACVCVCVCAEGAWLYSCQVGCDDSPVKPHAVVSLS